MCNTCGCSHDKSGDRKVIEVNQSLLRVSEEFARNNKKHFDKNGLIAINLISSPGSGKTTLLEKTIEMMKTGLSIGVLEGDIETDIDAQRIRAKGVPAVQLTTGGACHLESSLVHKGFHALEHELNGKKLDLLFIENVGNLVCPSFFDLGEHCRVVLISVPEGDDKPLKYPKAIRTSQVFIITKTDLTPYFDFDIEKIKRAALALNPDLKVFALSSVSGDGMDDWIHFLTQKAKK